MIREINTPLNDETIKTLKRGEMIYITGYIYTLRDAGHKKLVEMIENGENMPFEFEGNIMYYAGPCPTKPNQVIGSIGPTTSIRMDKYSPRLIEEGLRFMIGKGYRGSEVNKKIGTENGIYFVAIGGAAAKMSKCVKSLEIIAFEELGTEALRKLYVEKLPVVVATDSDGATIY